MPVVSADAEPDLLLDDESVRALFRHERETGHNPHVDLDAARRYGFCRLLASAPQLVCIAATALGAASGGAFATSATFSLDFRRPVLSGAELAIYVERPRAKGLTSFTLQSRSPGAAWSIACAGSFDPHGAHKR